MQQLLGGRSSKSFLSKFVSSNSLSNGFGSACFPLTLVFLGAGLGELCPGLTGLRSCLEGWSGCLGQTFDLADAFAADAFGALAFVAPAFADALAFGLAF